MFPLCKIHKFTWTSPDGKTHNQIDHILIDRRQHSSVYLMSDLSGGQTAVLTIIWWWQKLGRDWQWVNEQHKNLIWRGSNSRN
jgi:hypothetical protein